MTSPHVGIAELLGSAVDGLAYTEAAGGNVFVDHLPSEPDRAVAVFVEPGVEADSKLPYDPIAFRIMARSEDGGQWALRMAEAAYDAIHGLRNTTLPGGTYLVFALGVQASPFRHGPDEAGRPRYSIRFRGETINRTKERP